MDLGEEELLENIIGAYDNTSDDMSMEDFIKVLNEYNIYPITKEETLYRDIKYGEDDLEQIKKSIKDILTKNTKIHINDILLILKRYSEYLVNKGLFLLIREREFVLDKFGRKCVVNFNNNIVYLELEILSNPIDINRGYFNSYYSDNLIKLKEKSLDERNVNVDIDEFFNELIVKDTQDIREELLNSDISVISKVLEKVLSMDNKRNEINESLLFIKQLLSQFYYKIYEPTDDIKELMNKSAVKKRAIQILKLNKPVKNIDIYNNKNPIVYINVIENINNGQSKYDWLSMINNMNNKFKIFKVNEGYWREPNEIEKLIYSEIIKMLTKERINEFENQDIVKINGLYGILPTIGNYRDNFFIKYVEDKNDKIKLDKSNMNAIAKILDLSLPIDYNENDIFLTIKNYLDNQKFKIYCNNMDQDKLQDLTDIIGIEFTEDTNKICQRIKEFFNKKDKYRGKNCTSLGKEELYLIADKLKIKDKNLLSINDLCESIKFKMNEMEMIRYI